MNNDEPKTYAGALLSFYQGQAKNPEIESFLEDQSMEMFGRSRTVAIAGKSCVACGRPASSFRDELSVKEFGISGLCQACQDEVFVEEI